MSKELEAFMDILEILSSVTGCDVDTDSEHIKIVKQALLELESIKKAKPSEALKTLEVLDKIISPLLEPVLAEYEDELSDKITANYFALKQAILKAQESDKCLKLEELEKENQLLKEKNSKYKELEEQLEYPFEVMVKALKYGFSKSDKLSEKMGLAQTMKNFLNRIKQQVDVGTYIDGDNYCIRFYESWRKEKVTDWIGITEEEFHQFREMFKELENKDGE